MAMLLNSRGTPPLCKDSPAGFDAVNAHISAQVHAFFNTLHDLEHMSDKQSSDEMRQDEGIRPAILIVLHHPLINS
ncbi:Uu.00g000750.m01.CDS01 [Anthostomella pinea]|uniref:Uu.00g000750.m01.CDS01 n=1 Tax=Anthostomella pinea TaxID=933095 RepID=A0AAI8VJ87_9PEZI|nr:Uu.00g000750.m01.CDS01 [Anthostomella pinea]